MFLHDLELLVAQKLLPEVRRRTSSKTLQSALRVNVSTVDPDTGELQVSIGVPHYWAQYYHDGTDGYGPKDARVLVWFTDPLNNDPRLEGRYPVSKGDIRKLTPDQFRAGLAENRYRKAVADSGGTAFMPFMIIAQHVGPRGGHPFFERALKVAPDRMAPLIARHFDRWIRSQVISEKSTASISFL